KVTHTLFRKIMKLIRISLLPLAAILVLSSLALSQEGALTPDPPKGITPQEIIQKFAAKEKEFKQARDLYTFRQDVRVQTLDGDTVTGEYREVFDVTYDNQRSEERRVGKECRSWWSAEEVKK